MKIIKRINAFSRLAKSAVYFLLIIVLVLGSRIYQEFGKQCCSKSTVLIAIVMFALAALILITSLIVNYLGNEENRSYIEKAAGSSGGTKEEIIEIMITEKEYYEASLLFAGRIPAGYVTMIVMYYLFATLLLMAIIYKDMGIMNIVMLGFCFFYMTYPLIGLRLKAAKLYKIQKNLQKPSTLSCDGTKFVSKGEGYSNEVKILYDLAVNKDYLLLLLTPMTFIEIPRKYFKDEDQFLFFVKTAYMIMDKEKGITF